MGNEIMYKMTHKTCTHAVMCTHAVPLLTLLKRVLFFAEHTCIMRNISHLFYYIAVLYVPSSHSQVESLRCYIKINTMKYILW